MSVLKINSKIDIKAVGPHHAYLVCNTNQSFICEFSDKTNPDFIHEKYETMTVDDSRRIREIHEGRPFSADVPRVFVLEIHNATREAQNALLKILEEPQPNNYFFLVVPSMDILLPTVRSRLHILNMLTKTEETAEIAKTAETVDAENFLGMSLAKKIAHVDAIAVKISDEKATKYDAIEFVNSVERALYVQMQNEKETKTKATNRFKFEAIARARDYANDRAPSIKMLLEYVALSV